MNRRILILAAALVLAAVALRLLVSREDPGQVENPATTAPRAQPAEEVTPPEREDTLGIAHDDSRREAAVASDAPPSEAAPPTAVLRVRAISASTHEPLPLARLTVFAKDPALETSSMNVESATDSDGRAEFELPPGVELVLWIRGEEARTESGPRDIAALRAGETREMILELATGNDLRFFGRVVRRSDGGPVSDARVEARCGVFDTQGAPFAETSSDSGGIFALELASWQHPHLRIEAKGYGPAVVTPTKGHDTPDRALLIRLAAGATLDARVLDPAGQPIEGAVVRLTASSFELRRASEDVLLNEAAIPDELREAATASDGRCTLRDLFPKVRFRLEILRDGVSARRESEPLVLEPGQVLEREWRIGSGGSFLGLVLDQHDAPVANLEVWLAGAGKSAERFFQPHEFLSIGSKTTSDADGRFAFRDVSPGSWSIGPGAGSLGEPYRGPIATLASTFEMSASESREITLRVHRGLYIRGRVLGPGGEGHPKSLVFAFDGMRSGLQAEAGAGGRFQLGPLVPGSYKLMARAPHGLAPSELVEASSGQEDVELRLRSGGSVRGRVVDASTGEGCQAEMRVSLESPSEPWRERGTGWTGSADGSFDTDGLEPGLYGISAGTQDGRFGILRSVGVSAGAETGELVVAVSPGGTLRLKYEGKREEVACLIRYQDVQIGWGEPLEPGGVAARLAPAGSLQIALRERRDDVFATRTVELGVGEEKEIVFRDD